MYDAVNVDAIPAGATMVAGYFDGARIPSTIPALRARFPHAQLVTVAVRQGYNDADVYDVEAGDFTPASVVAEVAKGRARGKDPTVYTYAYQWSAVTAEFDRAGLAQPHFWIADWTNHEHLPDGAVACQWGGTGGYDVSAIAGYWPGVDQPPGDDMPIPFTDVDVLVDGSTGRGKAPTNLPKDLALSATCLTFQDGSPAATLEVDTLDGSAWVHVQMLPFVAPNATVRVRVTHNP